MNPHVMHRSVVTVILPKFANDELIVWQGKRMPVYLVFISG